VSLHVSKLESRNSDADDRYQQAQDPEYDRLIERL
jgi:hypothetical protein